MERRTKYGNDWRKRIEDSKKSLANKNELVKKFDSKSKKSKEKIINKEPTFGEFDQIIDSQYKNTLHKETFLFETKDGKIEIRRPNQAYENLASLFLEAREKIGLYIVLSWPEGIDWPHLSHILANKTITKDCNYEDGLKILFYPSSSRSINRGKDIRIDKNNLINEAKEAAANNRCCSRHHAYFALNDFEMNETENIRQNPCITQCTPFFELNKHSKWDLIGGGYFKDIYTHMFRASGNKRRPIIDTVASQLNNPLTTKEGAYLIEASVNPKDVVSFSLKPVKTDILYVDGRSKILNSVRGENELIAPVIEQWIKSNNINSLFIFVDNPRVYKKAIYESLSFIKGNKGRLDTNLFHRFSFFNTETEITLRADGMSAETSTIFCDAPELVILGKQSYNKLAKLYKIAKRMESYDEKLAHQMYRAIGYIDRLITLPVSQNNLRDWIRELTENWSEAEYDLFAKKYLWKAYKREWIQLNASSGAVTSKDDFLTLCDELAHIASNENETSDLLVKHLIDQQQRNSQRALVLVKEKGICEFVSEMLSDRYINYEGVTVDVAVYSYEIDASSYDEVYILGLKDMDLKDILFYAPKGRFRTKIYTSTSSAFKIEKELDIIIDLDSFEIAHSHAQAIKNQISPTLDSIRHLGIPSEFGTEKTYGNSYGYDYVYANYANIYLSNSQVFDVGKDTTIIKYIKDAFYAVTVENLEEGDLVLPLDGFIEDVEMVLDKSLPRESVDTDLLKSYFQEAQKNLSSRFASKTRKETAHKIFTLMKEIDSELCNEIHEGMVYRWVRYIEEFANNKGISSHSAKKKKHFLLFAKAIGILEGLSNIIWDNGIKAIRADHIKAGKGISNTLKQVLVKTLSGKALNLCDAEVETVISMAKQRLVRVEMIMILPNENLDMGK